MSGSNPLLQPAANPAMGANALQMPPVSAPVLGAEPAAATGFTAYHGSSHDFDRFDSSQLHRDEAGHYFALDEKHAKDYADPHMYQVHIGHNLDHFLDYGSLSRKEQDALNEPGRVQRLKDAGTPGIRFPDRTLTVFDPNSVRITRKYKYGGR